jgi:hypothetical protein
MLAVFWPADIKHAPTQGFDDPIKYFDRGKI